MIFYDNTYYFKNKKASVKYTCDQQPTTYDQNYIIFKNKIAPGV